MKNSRAGQVLLLLAVMSLIVATSFSAKSPIVPRTGPLQASPALTAIFLSTPGGGNHTDDLNHRDTTITFAVNATNSPQINGFVVRLAYNTQMYSVNFTGVDYSGNPFGPVSGSAPKAFVAVFCIGDKTLNPILSCSYTDNGPGDITLGITGSGNQTTPQGETSFALFYVTFNIIGTGLGQVHIFYAELTQGTGSQAQPIPLQPFGDAYYNNAVCPVLACKPPTVSFGFTPKTPSPGTVVTFNASATIHNSGAIASSYTWDWGDGQPVAYQNSTTKPSINQTITHEYNPNTVGTGSCVAAGNCTVTLSVLESDGIMWSTSKVVPIFHLTVLVRISNPQANPQRSVIPRAMVHVNASIVNLGTINEKAWAHITVEGHNLATGNYTLAQAGGSAVIQATWNTTGYLPRIYALEITLANVSSTQSHIDPSTGSPVFYIGDLNASSQDVDTAVYVSLITPQINGALSLSILQTTGIGALVLVALIAGLTRLRRKPSYETEPL